MAEKESAFGGLIMVLLILVVFIGLLNGDKISGKAVNIVLTQWNRPEMSSIEIVPEKFKAGEAVNINVYPGKGGVINDIRFYRVGNNLRVDRTGSLCDGTTCFEPSMSTVSKSNIVRRPLRFVTSTRWINGEYYVAIQDDRSRTWVKDYFEIE